MKKIGELRSILPKEIYPNVRELLDAYVYGKCDYLCISYEAWEKLFIRIVSALVSTMNDKNFNYFMGKVVENVNRTICNLINREIKEGKIYILDNLFIKLKREGYRDERLLAMFLLELNCLYVDFTEAVFNLLKNNSKKFNTILSAVGFKNLSYEEFVTILNKKYKLNIKVIKEDEIDYNELVRKYSNMTYDEIKGLFGNDFNTLPVSSINLLQRYFAGSVSNNFLFLYKASKYINFLIYGYKRKDTRVKISTLKDFYLNNKDKFNREQSLFLECFVFGLKEKTAFYQEYSNCYSHKAYLLNKLEMLYYGIDDIFLYTLAKEQYLEVLAKYLEEMGNFRKDILDDYYGVNGSILSIAELSKKYETTDDEMRDLIKLAKKYCLSLYSNLNHSQKINKDIYMPYVLDEKYTLNSETREALLLFMNGEDYESIAKKINKKDVSTIISKGIQKIDAYRFGIERPRILVREDIIVLDDELKDLAIEEINRHPSESVISEDDKKFLSYYFGIKCKYNLDGEILGGKKLQEKLGFKRDVKAKYKDIAKKLGQRKMGILVPELISIDRERLASILEDPHLPITKEDREIICSLLELNGYPLKSIAELAKEYDLTDKNLKRKYQIALININKYLIGEKEGIIDYDIDIVPNLRYFTLKEREVINDYYVLRLTNKQLAKKYGLSEGQITRIMYRIKTTLYELIKNPNMIRFDYDYYYQVVDKADFPFRGNLELAKRIFSLYIGENSLCRLDTKEIKQQLGIKMDSRSISRMIDRLVLGVFKYKDGIRKENTFSLEEIKDFYKQNANNLSQDEIILFKKFFAKDLESDCKISEDLTFLMLKSKYPEYFDISKASKDEILTVLYKYSGEYSKMVRNTLMFYGNISERELMSGSDINHVFRILNNLDRRLPKNIFMNRTRKIS